MSFFSIGKNEIRSLQAKAEDIEARIGDDRSPSTTGNVINFKDIALKHQRRKIGAKLAVLRHMSPDADNDGIA